MRQYLDLLWQVYNEGETRQDRTGVGTRSIFGAQVRYDLRDGFPLVTTKKINFSLVVRELLWFLSGSTNIKDLKGAEQLWQPWARENGDLGPIYGQQWRNWGGSLSGVDQITQVITSIKTNPNSRRHVVSAWNVEDVPYMALPPCHALFQFNVSAGYLDCQLYQRSADLAIGVPFNIASYALLLSMIANECGLEPRYFIHTLGDAHIYLNHSNGVLEQLKRSTRPLPTLFLIPGKRVLETAEPDIVLLDYYPHPFIKFDVAV